VVVSGVLTTMVTRAWATWSRWQVVSVVQAVCLLTLVLAEPFYQRRDHLDQSRYLKQANDNVVKDRTDAEVRCTLLQHSY
jgi:hypothetical protein